MADPQLFRLRVTYVKQCRLALLSHLELARAIERIVRRSGLPFAVSCGFSPHMRIGFGSALPVGVGSTCEIFDLYLTRYVSPERALQALRESCPEDLMVQTAAYVDGKVPAASVAFPVSTYVALLSEDLVECKVPAEIVLERKKGAQTRVVADYLVGKPEVLGSLVSFRLKAQEKGSLRPDAFLQACLAESGSTARVLSLARTKQE